MNNTSLGCHFQIGTVNDADKGYTLDGRISTAGEGSTSLSEMEDMVWLPRSWGTNPGKHCASNAGARILLHLQQTIIGKNNL